MVTHGRPVCNAQITARNEFFDWVCTRPQGHGGPHVALANGQTPNPQWCEAWCDCDPDLLVDEGL